jgi:hypothetical protein
VLYKLAVFWLLFAVHWLCTGCVMAFHWLCALRRCCFRLQPTAASKVLPARLFCHLDYSILSHAIGAPLRWFCCLQLIKSLCFICFCEYCTNCLFTGCLLAVHWLCALRRCCCCLQLNKSLREKLSALHTTLVLAGLLGDVLVAARRLRELLAAPAAGANADAAAVVKLLKLALDPVEQQVGLSMLSDEQNETHVVQDG